MSKPRPFSKNRLERLLSRPLTFRRHDVDCSIPAAVAMARLERVLGVRSTYFLMTDTPFYTPADALVFAAIANGLGHRIGWHIDARRTSTTSAAFTAAGAEVSFHCPRPSELWVQFPGFRSAYDPMWEGRYYADSRGRFAHGDPEDHPPDEVIQLNLHPEWWFDPDWHERVDNEIYESFFHESKWGVARSASR